MVLMAVCFHDLNAVYGSLKKCDSEKGTAVQNVIYIPYAQVFKKSQDDIKSTPSF